jgi:hypothetical protein
MALQPRYNGLVVVTESKSVMISGMTQKRFEEIIGGRGAIKLTLEMIQQIAQLPLREVFDEACREEFKQMLREVGVNGYIMVVAADFFNTLRQRYYQTVLNKLNSGIDYKAAREQTAHEMQAEGQQFIQDHIDDTFIRPKSCQEVL